MDSFALALTLLPVLAQPPVPGIADGSLTVGGKTVHLAVAYAWRAPNPFQPKEIRTVVLLTEKAVPPTALSHSIELAKRARRGELRGVLVEIGADGAPGSGSVYASEFPMGFLSVSGMDRFEKRPGGPGRIAGRLFMPEPSSWGPPNTPGITFTYTATLDVAVAP